MRSLPEAASVKGPPGTCLSREGTLANLTCPGGFARVTGSKISSGRHFIRLSPPRGRRVGEGRTGSLGLTDANYYLEDG